MSKSITVITEVFVGLTESGAAKFMNLEYLPRHCYPVIHAL